MDGSDILAGRIVADRYRLGERIGVGGMAEVRRADDIRLGRPVAVKFLDPHLAAQPDLRRRFEDEARAAARLNHPAVVQVFDSGEWEDRPFLVMELLSGRTLADEMAGGPLPVDRVRSVADDALSALGAAHTAGVLHRDVKPANLLIGADGGVKIADFGIAKADPVQGSPEGAGTSPATMTGQMLGTPSYLAPERVHGRPATPATDVWALGVVCWEALAGRRAFPGTGIQTAMAVASTDLAPIHEVRPDVDPALAHAIDVAVKRDPAERWTSAAEMRAALLGEQAGAGAAGPATGAVGPATVAFVGAAALGGTAMGAGAAATEVAVPANMAGPAGADATVIAPPPAVAVAAPATEAGAGAAGLAGAREWWEGMPSSDRRAWAFGMIAIAMILGIVLLTALGGGGHPKRSPAQVVSTPSLAPTTSTSTSTTTTIAPVAPTHPRGGGK